VAAEERSKVRDVIAEVSSAASFQSVSGADAPLPSVLFSRATSRSALSKAALIYSTFSHTHRAALA